MIRDAASSSTCSGASAGRSRWPSDGSPQIQPARPCSGPHSAVAGSLVPADSVSLTPPVFTQSYFHVKSFDLKVSPLSANGAPTPARMPDDWVDVPLGRLEQDQRHIDPVPAGLRAEVMRDAMGITPAEGARRG